MIDIQKAFDAMANASKDTRSGYHVTLGEMIDQLGKAKPSALVYCADPGREAYLGKVSSYRGYYSDLAFDPVQEQRTVADVLAECIAARGKTFEGYKGGEFVMEADTPLWISEYSMASGQAIIAIEDRGDAVFVITKQID